MNYGIASVGGVLKSRQMFFINSRCAQEAPDLAQEFKTFHCSQTRKAQTYHRQQT